MPLPDEDRRALLARLAPAGGGAADVVAQAVEDGEELREILVDAQGDVVAFTDRRALFVADGSGEAVPVDYGEVEVRQRGAGLAIDALIDGGRLILDVARGTFARLAVVGTGGPPGRASWLPLRAPRPRPAPAPSPPQQPSSSEGTPSELPQPPWVSAPAPQPTQQPSPAPAHPSPGSGPVGPSPAPAGGDPAPGLAPPWATVPPPQPGSSPAGPAPHPDPALAAMPPPAPRPAVAPPGLPPPGWHPDPSRRHWWRWWDGADWTDHVADGGPPSIDPLPPR